MRTRYLVGGVLAAALLSSAAIAQTTTTPAPAPAATTASNQAINKTTHWRASKMKGLNIYNEQNEKVGDINDIILDKDSKVTGYVIGVGGFLGMGEHDVLFEPGKIKFVNEPVRTAATTTTKTTTTTTANPPPANPNAAPTTTKNVSNTTATTRTTEWYPDHGVISGTKDQLKAMPQFKY
jgi:sporulation protein YlmC with PRC-barrel domain